MTFVQGWSGTLVRDESKGSDAALSLPGRTAAGCLTHARRKFDALVKSNASLAAMEAAKRTAAIYRAKKAGASADHR